MATLNEVAGTQTSNFDVNVSGLAHLVEHHIAVKEVRIFDQALTSGLDLVSIGRQLDAYRTALRYRYDLDRDGSELEAYLTAPALFGVAAGAASKSGRSRSVLAAKRHRKAERRAKAAPH